MKIYKTKSTVCHILLLGCLNLFFSCDLFLDIAPPKTELATDLVFESNSTANSAITSIYARMATVNGVPFSDISWLSGLSADEFVNYATGINTVAYYTNSLSPDNTTIASNFWIPYYNIIYQANAIIEGLEQSTGVDDAVKRQIIGEAKFVRAFNHFYLMGLFGDIPVITSTDYRINAALPRSTETDVYGQIIADLTDAKGMLNDDYVGADGLTPSPERLRPNKATATALLARAYLYTQDYEKAKNEATNVIDNPFYVLPLNLENVFLKNSTETIWQVQPVTNTATTFATRFVLTGRPATGANRSVTISNNVLELFTEDDLRFSDWVGQVFVSGTTYYFPNKHKVTTNNTTEYNMVMRLAEQYLIRAEAHIHLGNIGDGLADLNVLRRRANAKEFETAIIPNDPLFLLEEERQRELFAEGHRWFDLRRTGRIDEVMTLVTSTKGGQWRTGSKLYPIPQTERNNNPNLSQNDY